MKLTHPNVILINCDDLGYGDLGCYGSTRNATPALDKLAAGGMKLTSFYMASPVCSPSRGAMLTGCYPPRIGFGDFGGLAVLFPGQGLGLSPSEVTLGGMLSDAGYRTQIVGKWHCGDQPEFLPTQHGFDGYFGLPYSNDMGRQIGTPMRDDGSMRGYPPLPLLLDDQVVEQQPDQAGLTTRYLDEALRFIRSDDERPFFLYLAHMYVHLPIYVQQRFAAESSNGRYGAAVAAIDWTTAVIMETLKELGITEDTLVIFTSDNGSLGVDGGSNEPLRGEKTTTWEGGMRVPCIVHWPGRIAAGSVNDELTSAIDLLPTLARVCGAAMPDDRTIDGIDLSPLLFGQGLAPRETFFYYFMNDLEAVRDGTWKLHVAKRGHAVCELYNLRDDVGETNDVADAHPDVVQRLEALAADARVDLGDARLNIAGSGARPLGRTESSAMLTRYDATHPYYAAEYDLPDKG